MKFTEEQKNEIIEHCADLAINVDNMRQVIILTLTQDGMLNVIQKKTGDATDLERLGIYDLLAKDTRNMILNRWEDNERPMDTEAKNEED